MAMIRRDESEEEVGVQMTSMMDLVFLLLIFFIVTASLKKPQKVLPIDLPRATHAREVKSHKDVVISIDEKGNRYLHDDKKYFNQAPIGSGELMEYLRSLVEEDRKHNRATPVRLDVDRRTPYLEVMRVMDTMELYQVRKVYLRSKSGHADEKE